MAHKKQPRVAKESLASERSDSPGKPGSQGGTALRWLVAALLSIVVAWIFWAPLFRGGGLVGGDFYPYYLPQKQYLSDSLAQGVLPLWNDRTGLGYPSLGESQTGVFYSPNVAIYSLFDGQSGYNVSQLTHYVLAFLFTFGFARQLGLNFSSALLTEMVFVYGWFPARICLEWTIIGGCWMAAAAWGTTAFVRTGNRAGLAGTALAIGMSILAGHYHMAFITLLMLPMLCWILREQQPGNAHAGGNETTGARSLLRTRMLPLLAAMGIGLLIGGVQLLPTWELKARSARSADEGTFNPATDTLPPLAISQLWQPWSWYRGEKSTDELLREADWLAVPTVTNQVEAQFYAGLLPLGLAVAGLVIPSLRRRLPLSHPLGWLLMFALFLFLATGWPTYWLSDWPGFGYFRGTGRYSAVSILALAVLAGAGWQAFTEWRDWNRGTLGIATGLLFVLAVTDLWMASRKYEVLTSPFAGRQVFYSILIDTPPIRNLAQSPIRQYFEEHRNEHGPRARLLAPGANVPTLLGVSAVPVYLGLGPRLYDSEEFQFEIGTTEPSEIQSTADRLKEFGVTHLLTETPLDADAWGVRAIGPVVDPVLNAALSRREPYWFYECLDAPGRISFEQHPDENRILSFEVEPNVVRVEIEQFRDDRLILRDLDYPGWEVTNEGLANEPYREHFRSVNLPMTGEVPVRRVIEWSYRPMQATLGSLLSVLGFVGLAALLWQRKKND